MKQLERDALLAKTDIENAYKQIPIIHPDDFKLLVVMVNNHIVTTPFNLLYLATHVTCSKNLVPHFS